MSLKPAAGEPRVATTATPKAAAAPSAQRTAPAPTAAAAVPKSAAPKAGAAASDKAHAPKPPTADLTRPVLKDQLNRIRDGHLVGWECATCHHRSLAPMLRCPNGHATIVEKEFAKTGTIASYTVQVISTEQYMNEAPFAWVIVDLDEGGPRVTGWVPFIQRHGDLKVGQKVRFNPTYKPGIEFEAVKG